VRSEASALAAGTLDVHFEDVYLRHADDELHRLHAQHRRAQPHLLAEARHAGRRDEGGVLGVVVVVEGQHVVLGGEAKRVELDATALRCAQLVRRDDLVEARRRDRRIKGGEPHTVALDDRGVKADVAADPNREDDRVRAQRLGAQRPRAVPVSPLPVAAEFGELAVGAHERRQ